MSADRYDQLARNLEALEQRIDDACAAAGRRREELTLVAVTKTKPASDIRLLAELGVTDIGENRDQEAAPKAASCRDLSLTWHFVGQLQTNKCRSVVGYADVVHAVDRHRLVGALGKEARRAERIVRCLVQVDLGTSTRGERGGAPPGRVEELAAAVAEEECLRLAGVMAVAPLGGDPDAAFERLASIAARVQSRHDDARIISAGMSGDLEVAVRCGATHLRIGTALLGERPAPVG